MTVPPLVIAANRAELSALVATNILGQNTPAILANEAQYSAMWAQDAAAMYGYAAASASAGALNPLKSPAPTIDPGGTGAQGAAVSTAGTQSQLNQLVSALHGTMQGLASSGATGPGSLDSTNGFLNDLLSSGSNIGIYNDAVALHRCRDKRRRMERVRGDRDCCDAEYPRPRRSRPPPWAPALARPWSNPSRPRGVVATPVLAGVATSSTVGGMSVPTAWATAAPESSTEARTAAGWAADVDEGSVTNVAAGMPAAASTGRGGHGIATPRYGVKPKVMPTPGLL